MATEDDWKKIAKAVDQIYQRPDAEPFRAPVAYKELGLLDYPQIITKPMDLGTIKNKLKKREYATPMDLHKDVLLVFSNCCTYNQENSDFFKLATSLKKKWDDKFSRLLKDMNLKDAVVPAEAATSSAAGPGSKAGAKASLADRRTFAKSLYTITKEDLGKVLVEVEQKFPAALKRNATEDEVELNVDNIPGPLLAELTAFINAAKKRKTTNASKKAKTKAAAT